MELRIGLVGVRTTSARVWWRPGRSSPAQHLPKNRSEKKSPANSTVPSLSQSHPKRCFSSLPWALEMSVGGAIFCAPRAPGPPRLAAGAGGRNAETLKDFYFLGLFEAISSRLFFASEPPASKSPSSKLKQWPGR